MSGQASKTRAEPGRVPDPSFMVLYIHRNRKAYWGRTNDFCIKMDSDEGHFNVSLTVKDKVTIKTVSTDHNF